MSYLYKSINSRVFVYRMKLSMEKSPGWLRGVEIGLGILIVILSIYALAFPAATFVSVIWILAIILFILGIEKIIVGIFFPGKGGRWTNIGLGILILIFAGLAIAYPLGTAWIVTIFIGIALLFGGGASIVEGFSGKESGWKRAFLIGVGILLIIIGIITLVSPLFGMAFAGFVIAIGLLIAGIEMIAAGATGRGLSLPGKDDLDSLTGKK
jgi:uncharacterized membrane protein HdeD (DUF308 family)